MKRINVDFKQLVYQLIPPHKRQQNRVKFLQILTNISNLYEEFSEWRAEHQRLYNTTAQTLLLQGYLRHKFGEPHIYIRNRPDEWVAISLIIENQLIALPLAIELDERNSNPDKVLLDRGFPLIGEIQEMYGDADYMVIVPSIFNKKELYEELIIEIEKFNVIDKKYIISIEEEKDEAKEESNLPEILFH